MRTKLLDYLSTPVQFSDTPSIKGISQKSKSTLIKLMQLPRLYSIFSVIKGFKLLIMNSRLQKVKFSENNSTQKLTFSKFIYLTSILVAFVAGKGFAQHTGWAPVFPPTGGFNIEGDLRANYPGADTGDWVPGAGGTGGYVLNPDGTPVHPNTTYHLYDLWNVAINGMIIPIPGDGPQKKRMASWTLTTS